MRNVDVLIFVFILGFVIMALHHQILEFIWKVFYANLSDDKLEKLVRREYEIYDLDHRIYNDEGLNWLLQMSQHLQLIWKAKSCALSDNSIYSYWKEAEKQLIAELNRRKYFNSLT